MQGNQVGFESRLQQHLDIEQRRAVLEALGGSINPDSTLGEIIDAAEALGWSEKMGDLSLADLAEALLATNGEVSDAVHEDEARKLGERKAGGRKAVVIEDEDEEGFVLEVQEPAPARRKAERATAANAKQAKGASAHPSVKPRASATKATKKVAAKSAPEPAPARGSKPSKKGAAKPGKKAAEAARPDRAADKAVSGSGKKAPKPTSKKAAARRKPIDVDVDERMSLDQAAEFFLPYVEDLGEATMQALEEQTGVSRRKLRFHVGQLVKHGYLERHGMGRGTYYTRC